MTDTDHWVGGRQSVEMPIISIDETLPPGLVVDLTDEDVDVYVQLAHETLIHAVYQKAIEYTGFGFHELSYANCTILLLARY